MTRKAICKSFDKLLQIELASSVIKHVQKTDYRCNLELPKQEQVSTKLNKIQNTRFKSSNSIQLDFVTTMCFAIIWTGTKHFPTLKTSSCMS